MRNINIEKLIVLELNEINFEFVSRYIEMGRLPTFKSLFDRNGYDETTSESNYDELEPWIQWVTAHTGLSFADHKLFRLGDGRDSDLVQIWEHLEAQFGLKVAAMSPMNAANRTRAAPFFVPDPWTSGNCSGPKHLVKLYDAVSAAVNENAKSAVGFAVLWRLFLGLVRYGRIGNYKKYISLVLGSRTGKWRKALILDQLLADIFLNEWKRHEPDFSTLFVNAGAHIQHHYMFSSLAYSGDMKNPDWYIGDGLDPLLEVYELYDQILSEILALPETRVILLTALHQDPHEKVTYYYRLMDHSTFLRKIGVSFKSVEPRMSRDFLVRFASEADASSAELILKNIRSADGEEIFYVDNRGKEIFAMLVYSSEIGNDFSISVEGKVFSNFEKDVVFVAIKNGQHNGIGYFVDTGWDEARSNRRFPLSGVFELTVEACRRPE